MTILMFKACHGSIFLLYTTPRLRLTPPPFPPKKLFKLGALPVGVNRSGVTDKLNVVAKNAWI